MPRRVRAVGGGAVEAVKLKLSRRAAKAVVEQPEEPEEPDPDWWTRYYATAQARAVSVRPLTVCFKSKSSSFLSNGDPP